MRHLNSDDYAIDVIAGPPKSRYAIPRNPSVIGKNGNIEFGAELFRSFDHYFRQSLQDGAQSPPLPHAASIMCPDQISRARF